ncbi:hypothetical protein AMTR_s00006p00251880 [Amborella trichopoda]|uniref:GDSL esterase/lipase n=1 Tax=Amborella trichopoda TaxID=13333 RepID=W1PDI4_AMBTC|nr:hypothetical protein AMTR_s00006p00251880 [Amborella trichopoda]
MRNQLSLLLFLSLLPFLFMKVRPQQQLAPALYAFGDSLADDGNNNFLVYLSRSNYAPYGVDFPNGPTGRFTNGYTSTDIIGRNTFSLFLIHKIMLFADLLSSTNY